MEFFCVFNQIKLGDVFYGRLSIPGRNPKFVVIEILPEMASEQNRLQFLTKADVMRRFDHANVIYMEGVVTSNIPYMVLTEYVPYGSLLDLLRVCGL
jgi:abelson tyrosine-protein kinase 2